MSRIVDIIVQAKDGVSAVVGRVTGAFRSMGSGIAGFAVSAFKNLVNVQAGLQMLEGAFERAGAAVRRIWGAVLQAFKVETMTTQFAILMGSMDAAKQRMQDLQAFSAATPFQMEGIAKASRQLHVFSEGALGSTQTLRLIGDAAAAVGQPIEDLSFWVGRAYAAIKGGKPFGEAAMRLQEMGVLTPQVRQQMEELQKSGAKASEVFGALEGRLGEFRGGMDTLSKTGDGLVSTLRDNWTLAVADFGKAFMDLAKTELAYLIHRLQQLRADGTIEKWAESAKAAIQPLVEMVGNLFDNQTRGESLSAAWDYLKSVLEYGKDILMAAGDYIGAKIQASINTAMGREDIAASWNQAAAGAWSAGSGLAQAKFDRDREAAAARIAAAAAERRARAEAQSAEAAEGLAEETAEERAARAEAMDAAATLDDGVGAGEGKRLAEEEKRMRQERLQEIERDKAWLEKEAQRQMDIAAQEDNRTFRQKDVADRLAAKDAAEADEKDARKTARELKQAQDAQARGTRLSERRQALVDMENERLAKKENAEKAAAEARNKAEALHAEKQGLQAAIKSLPEIARDVSGMRASLDRNLQFG